MDSQVLAIVQSYGFAPSASIYYLVYARTISKEVIQSNKLLVFMDFLLYLGR